MCKVDWRIFEEVFKRINQLLSFATELRNCLSKQYYEMNFNELKFDSDW